MRVVFTTSVRGGAFPPFCREENIMEDRKKCRNRGHIFESMSEAGFWAARCRVCKTSWCPECGFWVSWRRPGGGWKCKRCFPIPRRCLDYETRDADGPCAMVLPGSGPGDGLFIRVVVRRGVVVWSGPEPRFPRGVPAYAYPW